MENESRYNQLGKVAWLWMSSPLHRTWPMESLGRFTLPPIALGQYLLVERGGIPVAYCSWARMNENAEARYLLNPGKIELADWNSGDRVWCIDWIAPFDKSDAWELKKRMAEQCADTVVRAIRVKKGSKKARVMEFKGKNISREAAKAQLELTYENFVRLAKASAHAREAAADMPAPAAQADAE